MAKKKIQPRRVPRAAEPRMYGDGKPSTQATERPAATSSATPARTAAPVRTAAPTRPAAGAIRTSAAPVRPPVTTTTDYGYVLKDLRRLGILSAGVFGVLVVLGLIIR